MHSILLLVYSSFITIYKEDHINSYHLLKKKKRKLLKSYKPSWISIEKVPKVVIYSFCCI